MRTGRIAVILFLLCLAAGSANAGELYRLQEVTGAPENLWEKIGGFCSIRDWHPMVESCEETEEDGAVYRTLALSTGVTVRHKLTGRSGTSYAYEAEEGQLSLTNYRATFTLRTIGERTFVLWQGSFDSFEDRDDRNLTDYFYSIGLKAIVACMTERPNKEEDLAELICP